MNTFRKVTHIASCGMIQNAGSHFVKYIEKYYRRKYYLDILPKKCYIGMHRFNVGKDSNGILRFFMNNEPVFFNGVLDQGYWPESLLTAPTGEALAMTSSS